MLTNLNTKNYFLGLFLAGLAMSCGVERNSELKVIQAQSGIESAELRVIGSQKVSDDVTDFFIVAGSNLHVVKDCSSLQELNDLLDTTTTAPLRTDALDLILLGENDVVYQRRSDLSCKGKFLPRIPDKEVESDPALYYSNEKYYFSSGSAGEYYVIDTQKSPCVYDLAAHLFGFEKRAENLLSAAPSDLNKSINLNCATSSESKYRLLSFTPPSTGAAAFPFSTILFLGYQGIGKDGQVIDTVIPFHRIDGELIKADSESLKAVVDDFKAKYRIKDVVAVSKAEIVKYKNRAFFDHCWKNCGPNFQPKVETLQFSAPPKMLAAENPNKALATADVRLRGQQVIEWKIDSLNQLRFVGCEGELDRKLGLSFSDKDWFGSLQSQLLGQVSVTGSIFECPKSTQPVTCEKILDRSVYSVPDFAKVLENKDGCASDATLLKIRVDANVTVEGTDPIRLNSSLPYGEIRFEPVIPSDKRSITYRYICPDKNKCMAPTGNSEIRVFNISGNKVVTFEGVDVKAAINSQTFLADNEVPTVRLMAFDIADGAQVMLVKAAVAASEVKGRNVWNTGAKVTTTTTDMNGFPLSKFVKSRFSCIDCSITAEGLAIDAQDGLVLVAGSEAKSSTLRGASSAVALRGGSEGLFSKATLEGETIATFGTSGHAYLRDLTLNILGDTLVKPVNAFVFLNKANGSRFTLDIQSSRFHGLPAEQVSSFNFAEFSGSDGSAIVNVRANQYFRKAPDKETELSAEDAGFFMRCKGKGKILYRFKNFCTN